MTAPWPAGRRVRRESAPVFADVAERHLDDVYAYLLYLTRSPALAEELTADAFEKALRVWHRFDPERGTPVGWLCRIARNVALDHFRAEERRRRRERAVALRGDEQVPEPAFTGLSPALAEALSQLSAADREVLALRIVLELDGETAARLLGISASACSTRLHRALERLERIVRSHALA